MKYEGDWGYRLSGEEWARVHDDDRFGVLLTRGEVVAVGDHGTATHLVVPVGWKAQDRFEEVCTTVQPPIEMPSLTHEESGSSSAQPLR